MKMNSALVAVAVGLSAVMLSGCVVSERTYVHDDRHVYGPGPGPGPRAVIVEDRPRGDVVIVRRPVPPPRVERVGRSPGADYVWLPGYWAPAGNDWVWVAGRYDRRPRSNAVWVEPRYNRRSDTEVEFSLGFWR